MRKQRKKPVSEKDRFTQKEFLFLLINFCFLAVVEFVWTLFQRPGTITGFDPVMALVLFFCLRAPRITQCVYYPLTVVYLVGSARILSNQIAATGFTFAAVMTIVMITVLFETAAAYMVIVRTHNWFKRVN
jgi:hypothetical protein